MKRVLIFTLFGVIAAIIAYALLSAVYAACLTTIYARSNLRVAAVAPVGGFFKIQGHYAVIELLIVLENVGDAAVEVEGYSYELYLITRDFMERYKLAEGETYLIMNSGGIMIEPGSNRKLYLTSHIDLMQLSTAAVEPLKNPREFKDAKFRLILTLKVPIKLFGLRISTYEWSETKDFELS